MTVIVYDIIHVVIIGEEKSCYLLYEEKIIQISTDIVLHMRKIVVLLPTYEDSTLYRVNK